MFMSRSKSFAPCTMPLGRLEIGKWPLKVPKFYSERRGNTFFLPLKGIRINSITEINQIMHVFPETNTLKCNHFVLFWHSLKNKGNLLLNAIWNFPILKYWGSSTSFVNCLRHYDVITKYCNKHRRTFDVCIVVLISWKFYSWFIGFEDITDFGILKTSSNITSPDI